MTQHDTTQHGTAQLEVEQGERLQQQMLLLLLAAHPGPQFGPQPLVPEPVQLSLGTETRRHLAVAIAATAARTGLLLLLRRRRHLGCTTAGRLLLLLLLLV
jgi:hypothetical protein